MADAAARDDPPPIDTTEPLDPIELAEVQHGVVARRQLRHPDRPSHVVRHLLRPGEWEAVTSEVVRRRGSFSSRAQSRMAAVLDAGGDAAESHLSAARAWGLSGCPDRPLHVVRTGRTRRRTRLAVVHLVRALPDAWVTRLDGVPICRPELVALQLFAVCRPGRAERLTDSLWAMRLLSGPSIRRFLAEHGACGRNGTAGLRAYLDARGDLYVPPASNVEGRAVDLFRSADIPMRRQVDSGSEDRWTGRVDFRHEVLPVIAEIQSERYHSALVDVVADRARIAALRSAGYLVVEITDSELFSRPRAAVERLAAAVSRAERERAAR